jgi:hypothetical protein
MGMNAAAWTPRAEGIITELSPSLGPLLPFLDQVTVVTNLELRNAYTTGNHASANCTFLSCARAKRTEGTDYQLGTTVDQIAAQQIGKATPIPSLELGTDLIAQVGNCDNGYACAYQNNLSWSSPTTPLPTEADPRIVFERLFGDGGTPEQRAAQAKQTASLLDSVLADLARLKNRLGAGDRAKVGDYVDSVREVERRIQGVETRSDTELPALARPKGVPERFDEHVTLMYELQWLAFRADLTRVVTFMLGRDLNFRTYPEIGINEGHHGLSHHQDRPDQIQKYAKLGAYQAQLFAAFLQKLKDTPEGNGSMLDQSVFLYGAGLSNPNTHSHTNLPLVVVNGTGPLEGGRHIVMPRRTPMTNLLLTLLDNVGVHRDTFGDSTGRLG